MNLAEIAASGRFKPSVDLLRCAEAVLVATAHHALLNGVVTEYQTRVLASELFINPKGVRVTDPGRSYQLAPAGWDRYHAACLREEAAAGLKPLKAGNCPALEADSLRIEAEHALVQIFAEEVDAPVFARFTTLEHRKKLLRLILTLVGSHIGSSSDVLNRYGVAA